MEDTLQSEFEGQIPGFDGDSDEIGSRISGFNGDMEETARAFGNLLRDHRAEDTVILDLRGLNSWTDFFVIATVNSSTQVQGALRHVIEYAREHDIEILRNRRKMTEDSWQYVDLGWMVVHLMTTESRSFYELERLWSSARRIPLSDPPR